MQTGSGARCRRAAGFTYVGVIVLVAIIGLTAACTVKLGSLLARRAAEDELLEVGEAFSGALKSYAAASLPGKPRSPATLEELLRDPRFAVPRRHLRALYADPITGANAWGLLREEGGPGIVAVYSLSEAHPIKLANFDEQLADFAGKTSYRDWQFGPDQARIFGARVAAKRYTNPLDLAGDPELEPDAGAPAPTPAPAARPMPALPAAPAPAPSAPDRISPLDLQ